MKVKFLRDHDGDRYTSGAEYLEGDVVTLPDANARMLVADGACIEVLEAAKPEPEPKPKADWKEVGVVVKGKK